MNDVKDKRKVNLILLGDSGFVINLLFIYF